MEDVRADVATPHGPTPKEIVGAIRQVWAPIAARIREDALRWSLAPPADLETHLMRYQQILADGTEMHIEPVPPDRLSPQAFSDILMLRELMGEMERRVAPWRNELQEMAITDAQRNQLRDDARSLFVLSRVIAGRSYERVSDAEFQRFGEELGAAAKELAAAIANESSPQLHERMRNVNERCDRCHATYRN